MFKRTEFNEKGEVTSLYGIPVAKKWGGGGFWSTLFIGVPVSLAKAVVEAVSKK